MRLREYRDSFFSTVKRHSEGIQLGLITLSLVGAGYLGTWLGSLDDCKPEYLGRKGGNFIGINFCGGYSEVKYRNYVIDGEVGDLVFLFKDHVKTGDTQRPYHAEFRPNGKLENRKFIREDSGLEFEKAVFDSEYARDRLFD